MKLKDARLCANCDEVYAADGLLNSCPACGSTAFLFVCRHLPTMEGFERRVEQMKIGAAVLAHSSPQ
jgi:predicted  nucleic acid-binding Zn-ribbon protein